MRSNGAKRGKRRVQFILLSSCCAEMAAGALHTADQVPVLTELQGHQALILTHTGLNWLGS